MSALRPYLIDETLTEETFVATDIDAKASGAFQSITGTIAISESDVARVDIDATVYKAVIYADRRQVGDRKRTDFGDDYSRYD